LDDQDEGLYGLEVHSCVRCTSVANNEVFRERGASFRCPPAGNEAGTTRREAMSRTTKEEALEKVKAAFGFVPNLMAGIADTNPAVATAYLGASAALEGGVLSPAEKQIVMLAVSSFNECH
jgi:hypothetical protein